jgi:hypothetical protein
MLRSVSEANPLMCQLYSESRLLRDRFPLLLLIFFQFIPYYTKTQAKSEAKIPKPG